MMRLSFIIIFLFLSTTLSGQLEISYKNTAAELVREKLVKNNGGVKIIDVYYYGSRYSLAYFRHKTPAFEIKKGILLSTGYSRSVGGPNKSENMGSPMGYPGDRDLSRLVRAKTNDAAVLKIEFMPYTDTIQFRYFFGSEEYPEYVNKGVNDVFAFFIRKADEVEYKNMAHLPDGTSVTVDNINNNKHSEFYIPNKHFTGYDYHELQDNPVETYRKREFAFDGYTTVLVAGASVEPYQRYELKIAIADVGDDLYDSGVFLEQGSLEAPTFEKMAIHDIEFELDKVNGNYDGDIKLKYQHDTLVVTSHIGFEFNKHNISENYESFLSELSKLIKNSTDVILNINGHTDAVGDDLYNSNLSYKRALSIANALVNKGVQRNRMNCNGFGSTQPIANDSTEDGRALNRRVEFQIIQKK